MGNTAKSLEISKRANKLILLYKKEVFRLMKSGITFSQPMMERESRPDPDEVKEANWLAK